MKIVCLSDTHGLHDQVAVPDGDLLLHAGDFTMRGRPEEITPFDAWLGTLPHRHRVVVAGNHDFLFEKSPAEARRLLVNATYLEDSAATIDGLRVWGSPWQPWFMDWAFNLRRGEPLREKWSLIPDGTDILVTHGPPHGIRDEVRKLAGRAFAAITGQGGHVGCEELLAAVEARPPRLHVFGHIHEGYGIERRGATTFVNASICDARYRPVNAPVVVEL